MNSEEQTAREVLEPLCAYEEEVHDLDKIREGLHLPAMPHVSWPPVPVPPPAPLPQPNGTAPAAAAAAASATEPHPTDMVCPPDSASDSIGSPTENGETSLMFLPSGKASLFPSNFVTHEERQQLEQQYARGAAGQALLERCGGLGKEVYPSLPLFGAGGMGQFGHWDWTSVPMAVSETKREWEKREAMLREAMAKNRKQPLSDTVKSILQTIIGEIATSIRKNTLKDWKEWHGQFPDALRLPEWHQRVDYVIRRLTGRDGIAPDANLLDVSSEMQFINKWLVEQRVGASKDPSKTNKDANEPPTNTQGAPPGPSSFPALNSTTTNIQPPSASSSSDMPPPAPVGPAPPSRMNGVPATDTQSRSSVDNKSADGGASGSGASGDGEGEEEAVEIDMSPFRRWDSQRHHYLDHDAHKPTLHMIVVRDILSGPKGLGVGHAVFFERRPQAKWNDNDKLILEVGRRVHSKRENDGYGWEIISKRGSFHHTFYLFTRMVKTRKHMQDLANDLADKMSYLFSKGVMHGKSYGKDVSVPGLPPSLPISELVRRLIKFDDNSPLKRFFHRHCRPKEYIFWEQQVPEMPDIVRGTSKYNVPPR